MTLALWWCVGFPVLDPGRAAGRREMSSGRPPDRGGWAGLADGIPVLREVVRDFGCITAGILGNVG
ncbi:hypothetical protein ACWC2H_41830, partial [Streptomyces sp. 900105755]